SAPRGSSAIAAIEPATGPKPNRCNASAASRFLAVMVSSGGASIVPSWAASRRPRRRWGLKREQLSPQQHWHGCGQRGVMPASKKTFSRAKYLVDAQGSERAASKPESGPTKLAQPKRRRSSARPWPPRGRTARPRTSPRLRAGGRCSLEQFCDLQHSRGDVRFTPESGQIADILECTL